MRVHFSRSLRTLDSSSSRLSTAFFLFLLAFLTVWSTWFLLGRVTVFASTTSARVEVDRENHPVDAEVGGRVAVVSMAVGQLVNPGDVLIQLDALSEQLAQDEQSARLAPAASQIQLLRQELAAQERALEGDRLAAQASLAQGIAESQKAQSAARFASEEAKRMSELHRRNMVSDLDELRAKNVAGERENEAQAAEFAARRLTRVLESSEQDRLAQIARLRREIVVLEGTQSEARAASTRLGHDIDVRSLRAPVAGRIAELAQLTPGSMVTPGMRICTIVPNGDLRVIAFFPPSAALGRILAGQTARIRLEGFPWTQFGSPDAHVSRVAGESRDGKIRVELTLDAERSSSIPLQHGLPAQVDIAVERTSPASLVMRSVGLYTRLVAAAP